MLPHCTSHGVCVHGVMAMHCCLAGVLSLQQLALVSEGVMARHRAESTLAGYQTKFRSWLVYCNMYGLHHLELRLAHLEFNLLNYSVFLAVGGLQYDTLRAYVMFGVPKWFECNRITVDAGSMMHLHKCMDGLKRCIIPKAKAVREPLLPHHFMAFVRRSRRPSG